MSKPLSTTVPNAAAATMAGRQIRQSMSDIGIVGAADWSPPHASRVMSGSLSSFDIRSMRRTASSASSTASSASEREDQVCGLANALRGGAELISGEVV